MSNDLCDPFFGDGYVCKNTDCKTAGFHIIIHSCSIHLVKEEDLKCPSCGGAIEPEA